VNAKQDAPRPLEKIDFKALDDVELLAHLLALEPEQHEVAERILDHLPRGFRSLPGSAHSHAFHGLGLDPRHRYALLAALEIGRRRLYSSLLEPPELRQSSEYADYISIAYPKIEQLVIGALFLDFEFHLIDDRVFFQGTSNRCEFEPFPILSHALRVSSNRLVLFTLRPRSFPLIKDIDVERAQQLKEAAEIVGIRLVDHLIVGEAWLHGSLDYLGKL